MKRRVLLLLLLLATGAIVNVAVACGIVVLEQRLSATSDQGFAPTLADGSLLHVDRYDSHFTTLIHADRVAATGINSSYLRRDPRDLAPQWANINALTPEFISAMQQHKQEGVRDEVILVGVGWPFRTGWYQAQHTVTTWPTGTVLHSSGRNTRFGFRGLGNGTIAFQRAFPTHVIWHGFLLNAMLFAAVLWLLVVVNPRLRQRQRTNRGLCPKCAYDLRNRPGDSSVCPECGATLR